MAIEKIKVHENSSTVLVDWEYALKACETLCKTEEGKDSLLVRGRAAILVLAEYAAIAHEHTWPPEDTGLVVVVCPPSVWFCPNIEKTHGLFVEPYSEVKHGAGIEFAGKDNLFDYCSIRARIDAQNFAAEMIYAGQQQQLKKQQRVGGVE